MPELSPKTGALREAVLAGELSGRDLLIEKREFHLKAEQPGEWTDAATGRHYEVVGREADGDLVTFFVRAWTTADKKTQLAFGRTGKAVGIERFRFQNIPTLTEDPLGGFEECGTDEETGLIKTRPKLIEDPLLVARELVRQQVGLTARIDPGADFKATGRTVTTFYPSLDGYVTRLSTGSWASVRDGAGTGAVSTDTAVRCIWLDSGTSNNWDGIRRAPFIFDTASLAGQLASAVTFSVYSDGTFANTFATHPDILVVAYSGTLTSLSASDYAAANFGTTAFATKAYASWVSGNWNDFTLSAGGVSNVNEGGKSGFALRYKWDAEDTGAANWESGKNANVGMYMVDQTGTTNDPKLTVTHEAAAAGGSLLMAAAGG